MTQVFIVSGTTYPVPGDFNIAANTIEVIGGGGAGEPGNNTPGIGAGGGGAGYSKSVNVNVSGTININVAAGGTTAGSNGGDTVFNGTTLANVSATAGAAAQGGFGCPTSGSQIGGLGGAAASGTAVGTGNVKNSGGSAVANTSGNWSTTKGPPSAGGGAAGPNGNGGSVTWVASTLGVGGVGGNGGGGNGGGSAGSNAATVAGANGGDNFGSTGHGVGGAATGTAGTSGTNGGGGGGGGATAAGGNGGPGNDIDASGPHGSGGGGGANGDGNTGGSANPPGNGGLYGGGGAGGGDQSYTAFGSGAQGIIVVTYTPVASSVVGSGLFDLPTRPTQPDRSWLDAWHSKFIGKDKTAPGAKYFDLTPRDVHSTALTWTDGQRVTLFGKDTIIKSVQSFDLPKGPIQPDRTFNDGRRIALFGHDAMLSGAQSFDVPKPLPGPEKAYWYSLTTRLTVAVPFSQVHWSLPIGPARGSADSIAPNFALLNAPRPFAQYDWPLPQGPARSPAETPPQNFVLRPISTTIRQGLIVKRYELDRTDRTWTINLLQTTLKPIQAFPIVSQETLLPKTFARPIPEQPLPNTTLLIPVVAVIRTGLFVRRYLQDSTDRTWVNNLLETTLAPGVQQLPFGRTHDALPSRLALAASTWQLPTPSYYGVAFPIVSPVFDLPQRAAARNSNFVFAPVPSLLLPPFFGNASALPLDARRGAGFVFAPVPSLLLPPFFGTVLDLPRIDLRRVGYEQWQIPSTIIVAPKPFAQYDWPLPQSPPRPLLDWQFVTNALNRLIARGYVKAIDSAVYVVQPSDQAVGSVKGFDI